MKLYKVKITIIGKEGTLEVDALASTREKPELAVHKGRTLKGELLRGSWTVTHTQSGMSALSNIPNQKAARAALEFLEGITIAEWTKPIAEWKDARGVWEQIQAYKQAKDL